MGMVLKRELVGRQSMTLVLDKYTATASMHPCETRTDGGVGHQEICEDVLSVIERALAYKALYCLTTGLESPNA